MLIKFEECFIFKKDFFLSFGNDSTTGHQMWTKHQFLHTWQLCEKKQVYATTVCHVLVVAHTLLLLTFLHIFLRLWAAIRVYNSRNSHLMFLIIQQMEKCPATSFSWNIKPNFLWSIQKRINPPGWTIRMMKTPRAKIEMKTNHMIYCIQIKNISVQFKFINIEWEKQGASKSFIL